MDIAQLTQGLLWYVIFLFSTTCHEAAHAWAAWKLGDSTAHQGGQVTLDPLPHIRREPIGMVLMPILSFVGGGFMLGWASTPYDPEWAATYPKRSAAMSLAGPAANLALMLFAALLIRVGMAAGLFIAPEHLNYHHIVEAVQPGMLEHAATLISILFSLNLLLGIFNLLPLPPLDGSGAIGLLMNESAARRWQNAVYRSRWRFLGLFIAWKLFDFIFDPIHLLAVNLLYPGANYH